MDVKTYKKDYIYSYTQGAFPTIELIKNKHLFVDKVIMHSSFKNEVVIDEIKSYIDNSRIFINDKLVEKLSDKGNQFIIGVFKKYECSLDENKDHILLDNPSNMGNLGTIIRSSLGFGIKNIAIIKPGVDIFDPKVIRSSMGSIFSTNIEYFDSLEEYKEKYSNHTIYSFMLQATKSLRDESFINSPLTLAFGNESSGLDLKYLNENSLIIKHSKAIDSLNITNAVSIALYEYSSKKSSY
ncbi:TrmH family RNA methyltransferase [bacterium]|nr:TrmH family RNA methyltransferase [bacterium]